MTRLGRTTLPSGPEPDSNEKAQAADHDPQADPDCGSDDVEHVDTVLAHRAPSLPPMAGDVPAIRLSRVTPRHGESPRVIESHLTMFPHIYGPPTVGAATEWKDVTHDPKR